MAITYTHIPDGSPYTAGTFNNRTSIITNGLNAITKEEMAHGALRTQHLPSPLSHAGQEAAYEILTRSNSRSYNDNFPQDTYTGTEDLTRPEVVFRTPIDFEDPDQSVNAILVLANIHVNRFLNPVGALSPKIAADPIGHKAFEDGITATFTIYAEDEDGVPHAIGWSNRTISPGICIAGIENSVTGYNSSVNKSGTFNNDNDSMKDVAIRTIILPGDVANGATPKAIKKLYINVTTRFFPGANPISSTMTFDGRVVIGKATLTAIPIQCAT